MAIPLIIQTIEQSDVSTWIRDSPSVFAFWFIITFHVLGMGLLIGGSTVIDLRILGVARDVPIAPLKGLYGIIWTGFWIQMISGTILLIGFPTKTLTNPDFYLKLTLIALGAVATYKLKKRVFGDSGLDDAGMMAKGRSLAMWSLVFWTGTIISARLLAYTYSHLKYGG